MIINMLAPVVDTAEIASAAQFVPHLRLTPAGRRRFHPDMTGLDYFEVLARDTHLHVDALRILPFLMPRRQAVWWGSLCAWHVHRLDPSETFQATLRSALAWAEDASEENRSAARGFAEANDLSSSAGVLAMAVFVSDGDISDSPWINVEAPEFLMERLIGSAVVLAGVERDPLNYALYYRHFLDLGMMIRGGDIPSQE